MDGLSIKYSNVNQAWLLMWHDEVLRIFNDKADAEAEQSRLRGAVEARTAATTGPIYFLWEAGK